MCYGTLQNSHYTINILFSLVDALNLPEVTGRHLYMPTETQQRDNMVSVYNKYLLSNVKAGVDGCHIPFLEKPRGIPVGRDPEKFQNRKGF